MESGDYRVSFRYDLSRDRLETCNLWVTLCNPYSRYEWPIVDTKGQLISECLLGGIDFPKNQRKFDKFLP